MTTPRHLLAVPETSREESPTVRTQLLLSVRETAAMMSVSESTVNRKVLTGEWPSILIGRSRRVVYLGLLRWIEGRQA